MKQNGVTYDPDREGLVPEPARLPLPSSVPWWLVGAALFAAFVALGIYGRGVHEDRRTFALLEKARYGQLTSYAFIGFTLLVPIFGAAAMMWASFVNPRRVDDMLWSAAMIVTSYLVGSAVLYIFYEQRGDDMAHTYPIVPVVVGLIGYGTFILVLQKSMLPRSINFVFRALCVLAVAGVLAYPVIEPGGRIVDYIGAILLAGSLFALGVFVAERAGVMVFARTVDDDT